MYKYYSADEIYAELLSEAQKLGKPFTKPSNRGAPLKISPEEYVAYLLFSWNEGRVYRGMERYSKLFVDKKLDHSTFCRNALKIPLLYVISLIEAFGARIEQLLYKATIAFADSTGVSTGIYEERIYAGQRVKVRKDHKLHILAGYFPEHSLTYVKTALGTDKRTSDAEGAKLMLEAIEEWLAYFLADRGYDAEKVHEAVAKKKLINIIKRKNRESKMASYRSLTDKFFNSNLYKEIRGVIETIFGGLTNCGLLTNRIKNPHRIALFSLAVALRHNVRAAIIAKNIRYWSYLFNKLHRMVCA